LGHGKYALEEAFNKIKKHGFDGVEMTVLFNYKRRTFS
jgi:sugar phosphate isomerase/epimerase